MGPIVVRISSELRRAPKINGCGRSYGNGQEKLHPPEGSNVDLQQLLGELALALLPLGITPTRFSKLARDAFVRAAAGKSRLRNGKVNHSKVAALTGLSRKEIRRILNRSAATVEPSRPTNTPSERVVHGWLTDRRFLTGRGDPKALAGGRGDSSFGQLVKAYGGDISPRAVLEELVRSGRVRRCGKRLKLETQKLPVRSKGLGPLTQVIPTIVDGLRIASHHSANSIHSHIYRLKLNASSSTDLALIRERCSTSVRSLLHGLQESLQRQLTVSLRKRSSRHTLTLTFLLADTNSDNPLAHVDSE